MTTRREFVEGAALSALGLIAPISAGSRSPTSARTRPARDGFLDLIRVPDLVIAQTPTGNRALVKGAAGRWTSDDGVSVTTGERGAALRVSLTAPDVGIMRLYLRWRGDMSAVLSVMGDAWERAYGDLEWRSWVPDRVMPWYFATTDGVLTHTYGVRTNPRAFCYWQLDAQGISLCTDVRSGSEAVELGGRALEICDVVCRAGRPAESAFAALHDFCRQMCSNPRLPAQPVYGSNDWYWAYGNNSADSVRRDAHTIVELSDTGSNRPFVVIDDGWQPGRGTDRAGAGSWDRGNEKFPDIPKLVADVRDAGARAGVWIRPLEPTSDTPDAWRLKRNRGVLDPTVPDVREKIAKDIRRIGGWGFELIKHDYTTFDILGRWGFQMGSELTSGKWTFAAGTATTTAEIIGDMYRLMRTAAGACMITGCNTVSHLSTGHFELCRIGDDTSGTDWSRTRKMGVNSLAFRGAQHDTFYAADADCVGVTNAISWAYNRQWLDLLARSGTTLFVSMSPDAMGAQQRHDIRAALAIAASRQTLSEPLDWERTVYPKRWRLGGAEQEYNWVGPDGVGLP